MEKQPPLPMTPFDTLVTSPELQMIKLMLPYIPLSYQRSMAFYIKFTELQNAIHYFGLFSHINSPQFFGKELTSPLDILNDLGPYMGMDKDTIDMILSAMNMMEMMQGMDMPDMSSMGDMSDMMSMMNMFTNSENNDTESDSKKEGFEEYE